MSQQPFLGVFTALVTPFKTSGEVDFVAFKRLLELQKQSGIHGVVILGTTGESPTLTEQESEQLILAALIHRSPNFHIYVGSGGNSTSKTVSTSVKYSQLSCSNNYIDGIMVVSPYYNKPQPQHLINHFTEVFSAIPDLPVCIYNHPGRTGVNLTAKIIGEIVQKNKNVTAIKEVSSDVSVTTNICMELNRLGKSHVHVLLGDDATFAPALVGGARGVISVTANLIPNTMLNIYQAASQGNWKEVQSEHLKAYCINAGIFALANPVGIKAALSHVGLCESHVRAPLYAAQGEELQIVSEIFSQLAKNKVTTLCR